LRPAQVAALRPAQVAALRPAQVAELPVAGMRKLSRSTMGAMTPRSDRALSVKQIETMPKEVVWGISKPAYAGMNLLQQGAMKQASGWFR
jgi:hypothetical protein